MSKSFGKIVLASTILAGAALGLYTYLKKEGLIEAVAEPVKNDLAAKMGNDAADLIKKERSYVDISADAAGDAVKETVEAVVEEVKEVKEEFEAGIQAENIEAAEDKVIGSTTSEEFFNDEK